MKQVVVQQRNPDGINTRPGRKRVDKLPSILAARLAEGELRLVCFQLGIDYYHLPGEGKHAKTQAMVALLVRQHRLPELISTVLLRHPEIPWKKLLNLSRCPRWVRGVSASFKQSLPVLILLSIMMGFFAVIPLSSANWHEVLGVTGEIFTGTWDDSNCTHPQGYWKQHPEDWPVDGLIIGEVNYLKEEALVVLDTPPGGDATFILAHQLLAASLNIFNGADPSFIEQTILDADQWLVENPLGGKPKNPARQVGIALAEVLEMYNTGEIGPGLCADDQRQNISSLASLDSIFSVNPLIPGESGTNYSATPVGMLPELPGAPPPDEPPEIPGASPPSPGSEPPNTPLPTQPAEPTQNSMSTPTSAPTQDPNEEFTATPGEPVLPTPTLAPTADQPPTSTNIPVDSLPPTPTIAPTAYAGPPGCTQPLEYWLANDGPWPQVEFAFGLDVYNLENTLGILLANPQGDATYILARQYITAQLNIASPADPTAIIEELDWVKGWFFNHPLGSAPKNPDRKEGLAASEILEEYNLGLRGSGPCQLPTPTPTATGTYTPIPESSWTPTAAPTMAPTISTSPTATPTPELPTEISP